MSGSRKRLAVCLGGGLLLLAGGLLRWSHQGESPPDSPSAGNPRPRVARDAPGSVRTAEAGRSARTPGKSYARLFQNDSLKMSPDQIDGWLASCNRDAESLLTAYLLSGRNAKFLEEALERFPDHPQVLQTAVEVEEDPEKKLVLLERYMRSAPGNGLADCLAASALMKLGRVDEAVDRFLAAAGKGWTDYTKESVQSREEAYLSAGHPELESRLGSAYGHSVPSLIQMRSLGREMAALAGSLETQGDAGGADALRQGARQLASRIREGAPSVVQELIASLIEKNSWKGVDTPEAEAEMAVVRERSESLARSAEAVGSLLEQGAVTDADTGTYLMRLKSLGEAKANAWLLERYPAPPPSR